MSKSIVHRPLRVQPTGVARHQIKKSSNSSQVFRPARDTSPDVKPMQTLNLETVLVMEAKLGAMLEALRCNFEVYPIANEYWELCLEGSFQGVPELCADTSNRSALRKMMILEAVGIFLACSLDLHPPTKKEPSVKGATEEPHGYPGMRNMLYYVHQNFLCFTEFIIKRLSEDNRLNFWAQSLTAVVDSKLVARSKRNDSLSRVKQNNNTLCNLIWSLMRQVQGDAIKKPTACSTVLRVMQQLDDIAVEQARDLLSKAKASFRPEALETAMVEMIPAPYLPEVAEDRYTLVLDLDETLIHYFEGEGDGFFLVRPGCDTFLRELSKVYEVIIFTAALQDVRVT